MQPFFMKLTSPPRVKIPLSEWLGASPFTNEGLTFFPLAQKQEGMGLFNIDEH